MLPEIFSITFPDLVVKAVRLEASREHWEVLSDEERERASRFATVELRERAAASRSFLRRTLADLIGASPSELAFRYSELGKPYLEHDEVFFNLSHSDDVAAVAVSPREVGVDVEKVKPEFEYDEIVASYFSIGERAALGALRTAELKRRTFFEYWTRKEAVAKCLGKNLSYALDRIDCSHKLNEIQLRHWSSGDLSLSVATRGVS